MRPCILTGREAIVVSGLSAIFANLEINFDMMVLRPSFASTFSGNDRGVLFLDVCHVMFVPRFSFRKRRRFLLWIAAG
jgi:hypothetical protein